AERDVDATHVGVALVEDGIDDDRGLAGLTVADDQLALTASDRDHRVDRLDTRLQRLLHGLARDDSRSLEFERTVLVGLDWTLTVEWVAERVDHAAEQRIADRNARDLARASHRLALLHVLPLAEERRPDVVLLEVEREPYDTVLELEHFHRDAVLEPVDAGNPVTDR